MMIAASVEERNEKAEEYLQLLRSLAVELDRAMRAIARNHLSDLEESIENQQILTGRLIALVQELSAPLQRNSPLARSYSDDDQMQQIFNASEALQQLNQRYAALLKHSSRSVALMASLFGSFRGQLQEASGPRLKHQTWSCQM